MENTRDDRGALTAAGVSCGSCGTELRPNSKFCNECGEPVAQLSRSAEYKQVTVECTTSATAFDGTVRVLRGGHRGVGGDVLQRGTEGDVREAEAAVDRLAAAPVDDGLA